MVVILLLVFSVCFLFFPLWLDDYLLGRKRRRAIVIGAGMVGLATALRLLEDGVYLGVESQTNTIMNIIIIYSERAPRSQAFRSSFTRL